MALKCCSLSSVSFSDPWMKPISSAFCETASPPGIMLMWQTMALADIAVREFFTVCGETGSDGSNAGDWKRKKLYHTEQELADKQD